MENSDDVENEKNNLGSTGQNHTSTVENSENDLSLNDSLGDDAYKLIFKDIHPVSIKKKCLVLNGVYLFHIVCRQRGIEDFFGEYVGEKTNPDDV